VLTVGIVSLKVGEEEFVLYPVPTVIIAAGELTLNFDKLPKACTAFSAPGTIKCNHTVDGMLAGRVIKRAGQYSALCLCKIFCVPYKYFTNLIFQRKKD
jgi:hypothetical protein